jgi:hypothetical protein
MFSEDGDRAIMRNGGLDTRLRSQREGFGDWTEAFQVC